MVVTLGQQYNVGEKPIVILYTYINRYAGTPEKQRRQNSTSSNIIIYCYIGYKDEFTTKFDFTVDEGKEWLNPSRDKNQGTHRRRKVD